MLQQVPDYFQTRFRLAALPEAWPESFAIITAWATTGQRWSEAENAAADARLRRWLDERRWWRWRITGYSPHSGHAEPGWACPLPLDQACDLGVAFRQDAIYYVSGDELAVTRCAADRRQLVPVDRFRRRLDVDPLASLLDVPDVFPEIILGAAERVMRCALERRLQLVVAESCTGGLLAAALTSLAGSSRVLDRGFVTYSNASKTELLGVPAELIQAHGAVSEPVAIAMAEGALERAAGNAQLSLSVTGIAGPDGSPGKPVGLVHCAAASWGKPVSHRRHLLPGPDRNAVRQQAVLAALQMAVEQMVSPEDDASAPKSR